MMQKREILENGVAHEWPTDSPFPVKLNFQNQSFFLCPSGIRSPRFRYIAYNSRCVDGSRPGLDVNFGFEGENARIVRATLHTQCTTQSADPEDIENPEEVIQ